MSTWWPDAQRIIAITQVARGDPARTMRRSFTTALQLLTGRRLAASAFCSTGPADLRRCYPLVVQPCRQSTLLAAEGGHRTEPYVPEDLARTRADGSHLSHMTDMAGFSEREQEEFLLICGPRKETQSHQGPPQGTRARAEETERVIGWKPCWAT